MAQNPPPNVKIYDRPPPRGPSPLVLVIAVVVILIIAFVAYRMLHHAAPVPARAGLARPATTLTGSPRFASAAGIKPAEKRAYWEDTAARTPLRWAA